MLEVSGAAAGPEEAFTWLLSGDITLCKAI